MSIIIWDAKTGDLIFDLIGKEGYSKRVESVKFSSDSSRLLANISDKPIIWNAKSGVLIKNCDDTIVKYIFSPDDTSVLIVNEDKLAMIWDTITGAKIGDLKGHSADINSFFIYSPDGTRLVTLENFFKIWDAKTGSLIAELLEYNSYYFLVSFSQDSTRIVITTKEEGLAMIWDAKTGDLIGKLMNGQSDKIINACFSPDDKLVTCS